MLNPLRIRRRGGLPNLNRFHRDVVLTRSHKRVCVPSKRRPPHCRVDRAAHLQEQIPAVRHSQFRTGRYGLFSCRKSGCARLIVRLCLERAMRSILRQHDRLLLLTYDAHRQSRAGVLGGLRLWSAKSRSHNASTISIRRGPMRPPTGHTWLARVLTADAGQSPPLDSAARIWSASTTLVLRTESSRLDRAPCEARLEASREPTRFQ
jgi:hypothetical protein